MNLHQVILPRKLSKLQKKILFSLILARGSARWPEHSLTLTRLREYVERSLKSHVHKSSFSRALRRLEDRGLILRSKGYYRSIPNGVSKFTPVERETGKTLTVQLTEMGIKVCEFYIRSGRGFF